MGKRMMFPLRHQYDEEANEEAAAAAAIHCCDESLTQQQFKEDADINVLARRFGLEEKLTMVPAPDPRAYGDVSEAPDFRTLQDRVRDAENRFMAFDPAMRRRFGNSVGAFWKWVNDKDNWDEAVRLGFLARAEPSPPAPPAPPAAS